MKDLRGVLVVEQEMTECRTYSLSQRIEMNDIFTGSGVPEKII